MRMKQALSAAAIVAAMAAPAAVWAGQQPPAHNMAGVGQPTSQAAVAECAQAQPRLLQTIAAADMRLEAARQSNSPAAMRAAMDDLQGALGSLRAQLAACAALQAAAPADPHAGSSDNLIITFHSMPSPPRGAAENQFEVTVADRQGKPIDGADVSLLFSMPPMPTMKMGEMRSEVGLKGAGSGRYAGAGQVMMAGSWTITVRVRQNGNDIGQQNVTVTAK